MDLGRGCFSNLDLVHLNIRMMIYLSLPVLAVIQVCIYGSQTNAQTTPNEDHQLCLHVPIKECQNTLIKTQCINHCTPKTDHEHCQYITIDSCRDPLVMSTCPNMCRNPPIDGSCNLDWIISPDGGFRPLILDNSNLQGFPKIILPLPDPGISIESGTPLIFACSGKDKNGALIIFKNDKLKSQHAVDATCENGELIIHIGGKKDNFQIKDLGCVDMITSDIIKKIGPKNRQQEMCGHKNNGFWWQIAFDYNSNEQSDKFYPQIDVCFEKNEMTTIWTQHTMYGKSLKKRKAHGVSKTFLQTGDFFGSIIMDDLYEWEEQEKILGKTTIKSEKISFHRGHLSPNGDFVTGAEQVATYNYINALPQWQPYNGGNWKITEQKIVNLAKDNNAILNITTGGTGIIKKRDGSTTFLAQSLSPPRDKVPIPYYLWKVVVAEKGDRKKAVPFVINNNPLVGKPLEAEYPCANDICSKLDKWINPNHIKNMKNPEKGYTFCCEVNELKREIVPNAPIITDAELLTNLNWESFNI